MKKLKTLGGNLVRQVAALRRCWLPALLAGAEVLLIFASGLPVVWGVCAAWLGLDVAAALLAGRPGLPGLIAQLFLVAHTAMGLLAGAALLGELAGAVAGSIIAWTVAAMIVISLASAYQDWLRQNCLR